MAKDEQIRETTDEELRRGIMQPWVQAMALEVVTVDGRSQKHGSVNGKDNLAFQFINLAGSAEVAVLVKEQVFDKEDKIIPGLTKDSIYPVQNMFRVTALRVEKTDDKAP